MLDNRKESQIRTLLYRLRFKDSREKQFALWTKEILYKFWGDKPVPLVVLFLLSKLVSKSKKVDFLYTKAGSKNDTGIDLKNPKLSYVLKKQTLGKWSLDAQTINYLEKDIEKIKPNTILEFGSGISTLCLAQFLAEIHEKESIIRVCSIEQDKKFAKESEKLINDHGYGQNVRIIYAPLFKKIVEGDERYTYDLNNCEGCFDGLEFDYCLIDGPSATGYDGRFATLPLVRKYMSKKARFVLDDALRPNELLVAKKWNHLSYIDIQGIVLTPKGLLTGFVRN